MQMQMPGMGMGMGDGAGGRFASMGGHGGPPNLLPGWLGAIGALVFIAILLTHLRHATRTHGSRRLWHCGHVLMAASMVVMYLPSADDPIALEDWRVLFLTTLGLLVVSGAVMLGLRRRAPGGLWLLLGLDLATMAYMWSPGSYSGPVSAVVAIYLLTQAALWASDRIAVFGRPAMCAMTLGMAYMVVAMQVMS